MKDLGIGVTLPQKAELEMNGVRRFAVFKTIDDQEHRHHAVRARAPPRSTSRTPGSSRSRRTSSIASSACAWCRRRWSARINGKTGSLQWWVVSMMSEAERLKKQVDADGPGSLDARLPEDGAVRSAHLQRRSPPQQHPHHRGLRSPPDRSLALVPRLPRAEGPEELTRFSQVAPRGHPEARVSGPAQEGRPLPARQPDPHAARATRRDPRARQTARRREGRGGGDLSLTLSGSEARGSRLEARVRSLKP